MEPIIPVKPKATKPKAQPAKSKLKTAAAPLTFASRQLEASNNKRSAAVLFTPYKHHEGVGHSANEPQPSPTLQPAACLATCTAQNAPRPTQNVPHPAQNVPRPAQNVPRTAQNVPRPAQNVARPSQNVAPQLVSDNLSDDDVEEELEEGLHRLNFDSDSQSHDGSHSHSGSNSHSGSQSFSRPQSRSTSPSHSRHAPRAGPHSKPQKAEKKPRASAKDVWTFYTQVKKRHTCVLCQ